MSLALSSSAHAAAPAQSGSTGLQVKTAEQRSLEDKRDNLVMGAVALLAALYKLVGSSTADVFASQMITGLNTPGNVVENVFKRAVTTVSGDGLNKLEIATESDIKEIQAKIALLQARLAAENQKAAQANAVLVEELKEKILKAQYKLILAEKSYAEQNKKLATEKAQRAATQADIDQVTACGAKVKEAQDKLDAFKVANSTLANELTQKTQDEAREFEGFKAYITRRLSDFAAEATDLGDVVEGSTTILDRPTKAKLTALIAAFQAFCS